MKNIVVIIIIRLSQTPRGKKLSSDISSVTNWPFKDQKDTGNITYIQRENKVNSRIDNIQEKWIPDVGVV